MTFSRFKHIIGPIPRLNPRGFTLIEIILTMVIIGVIGSMGTMGFMQVTQSFVHTKQNAATVGQAQLAMLRLVKEMTFITGVSASSSSSITFTTYHGNTTPKNYTIAVSSGNLTMNDGATDDILIDKVSAFALAYYDTYAGTASSSWTSTSTIIEFTITVTGADNTPITFSTRIIPRNL